MKRSLLFTLTMLTSACFAIAPSVGAASTDVLGAHLNYGRGCPACHIPHSGAAGNGTSRISTAIDGNTALWGEDASSLYGDTIIGGGGKVVDFLPASVSMATPEVAGMLTCLTCHDGNYAPGAMMRNQLYETLPASYGARNATPTLLGNNGVSAGSYVNQHPVGLNAKISCGASHWDCTQANGMISMNGAASSRFVKNYGFFVQPGDYGKNAVVVCTTCHNQHSMNVITVSKGSTSGLPAGNYSTVFFLRAPYNPNDPDPMAKQTTQFCRQCHGDKSNEMNGGTAATVF